jgi:HK97 family phage portal protein
MGLWDRLTRAVSPYQDPDPLPSPLDLNFMERTRAVQENQLQTRAIDSFTSMPGLTEQLLAVQGLTARPWRYPGITEALGVPAIFGAVNLIANLTGSMTMRALRNEIELAPADRPRIIVRPDPFTIPREFYRMTAYNLATRGEAWWWVGARDGENQPMSEFNAPPHEVTVEENRDDLRYPIIKWRNKVMRNEDFIQLVYSREPGQLRGVGPLQMCGAAISVAVESQEWAANFFIEDGGHPSIWIKAVGTLSEDPVTGEHEAVTLRNQWMGMPNNTPRVTDDSIEDVKVMTGNEQGAAMLRARSYQNSEVATMYNMDATILNAAVEGSSLRYQNVGHDFDKLLRQCLRPNYLEVIEQTMSDLLPRATVARFNTSALTMDDPKTRAEVYDKLIPHGIVTKEEARKFEGYEPGDVEKAAVPASAPQAIPASLPIMRVMEPVPVRCDGKRLLRGVIKPCNKLLAESGPFVGRCPRCSKEHKETVA